MSEKNGGPAYPSSNEVQIGDFCTSGHAGMTLRDYFAAKAMQAYVSSYPEGRISHGTQVIAEDAWDMADAMLEAREQ